MTIWRKCIACWIPKATNTHSQYVILTAFPLQQWLKGRVSMLRYMYTACHVNFCYCPCNPNTMPYRTTGFLSPSTLQIAMAVPDLVATVRRRYHHIAEGSHLPVDHHITDYHHVSPSIPHVCTYTDTHKTQQQKSVSGVLFPWVK